MFGSAPEPATADRWKIESVDRDAMRISGAQILMGVAILVTGLMALLHAFGIM